MRTLHCSWRVEEGVILMGGFFLQTELVKWDGTTEELFSLKYRTM